MRVVMTGIADAGGNSMQGAGILNTSGGNQGLSIITGSHTFAVFQGIIIIGSNGGTVQFKWSQDPLNNNAPNANGTTMNQYSYFKLSRIK
jgi:hypothetical protein